MIVVNDAYSLALLYPSVKRAVVLHVVRERSGLRDGLRSAPQTGHAAGVEHIHGAGARERERRAAGGGGAGRSECRALLLPRELPRGHQRRLLCLREHRLAAESRRALRSRGPTEHNRRAGPADAADSSVQRRRRLREEAERVGDRLRAARADEAARALHVEFALLARQFGALVEQSLLALVELLIRALQVPRACLVLFPRALHFCVDDIHTVVSFSKTQAGKIKS